jgi:hypothetical protein
VVVTHSRELAELFPRTLLMEDGTLRPADAAERAPETGVRTDDARIRSGGPLP